MKSLKNERGGPLNVEIHVLFYGENSWTVALKHEVLYIERSLAYLQVLFESLFSLMELSNTVVIWHFEVMLDKLWTSLCRIL
jgi:hypothetical protein